MELLLPKIFRRLEILFSRYLTCPCCFQPTIVSNCSRVTISGAFSTRQHNNLKSCEGRSGTSSPSRRKIHALGISSQQPNRSNLRPSSSIRVFDKTTTLNSTLGRWRPQHKV